MAGENVDLRTGEGRAVGRATYRTHQDHWHQGGKGHVSGVRDDSVKTIPEAFV